MKNNKSYSDAMKHFHGGDLKAILNELQDGKQVYTHHFEFKLSNGKRYYQFSGKENRPHLRKCLWSLEADGLIENIDLGFHIHQWKTTKNGQEFLKQTKP